MVWDKDIADSTLAIQAAAGETAAFETLLHRYRPRLLGIALRIVNDPIEAEDIVQEALVTAWRKLPQLVDPGAVRPWLCQITTRQCLLVLRKRRGRRTIPVGDLYEPAGAALNLRNDPHRAIEVQLATQALHCAVRKLPPPQRAVWLLAEQEGLCYADIARTIGGSEQSVRGRLFRARAMLARTMMAWR